VGTSPLAADGCVPPLDPGKFVRAHLPVSSENYALCEAEKAKPRPLQVEKAGAEFLFFLPLMEARIE